MGYIRLIRLIKSMDRSIDICNRQIDLRRSCLSRGGIHRQVAQPKGIPHEQFIHWCEGVWKWGIHGENHSFEYSNGLMLDDLELPRVWETLISLMGQKHHDRWDRMGTIQVLPSSLYQRLRGGKDPNRRMFPCVQVHSAPTDTRILSDRFALEVW